LVIAFFDGLSSFITTNAILAFWYQINIHFAGLSVENTNNSIDTSTPCLWKNSLSEKKLAELHKFDTS
jgi:hypothetical protein